jgi:predicted dehydrogenase
VEAFYEANPGGPVLLTGFNRRFSPYGVRIAELVAGRVNPLVASYRMNAGYLPLDHWTQGPQGGGRNRGEACHIYDLFTAITGSPVERVQAAAIRPATGAYSPTDNFVATASFRDGSVCTLAYTALGAREYPKERMDLFVDGKVLALDDYRRLEVHGARVRGLETKLAQKGQKEELEAFARAVRGGEWPIPLWQQVQATRMALEVEAQLVPASEAVGPAAGEAR